MTAKRDGGNMIKSKIKNMVKTIIKSFKKVGWRCMDTGPIDVHMNGQIHRIIRFFGFTVSGKLDGQKGKGGGYKYSSILSEN
jgi:hypothetical protein